VTGQRSTSTRGAIWGVALMVGAFYGLDLADGLAKLMTGSLPVVEVVIAQYVAIMVLAPFLLGRRRLGAIHRLPDLHILLPRSLCQIAASIAFVYAVKTLALADVVAIGFMAPFMITALTALFLKETGSAARWIGCFVCFAGALIILRPGIEISVLTALLPLGYAFFYAVYAVMTRYASARNDETTLLAMNGLVCGPIALLFMPFANVIPSMEGIEILIAIALINAGAKFLIIKAYTLAPASLLAPFQYLEILGAFAVGFLLFGDLPDGWTWAGIALIVLTSLGVMAWEARRGHTHGTEAP